MIVRQWYPQLDVFDTVRRYIALLSSRSDVSLTRERLFVVDFYLVNPSLLHSAKMTADVRKAFNKLRIDRPEKMFILLPSPPVLYNKMAGIQSEALSNLVGRGLCDIAAADSGRYRLSPIGAEFAKRLADSLTRPSELAIIRFLTTEFAAIGQDKGGLRAATGLMRIGA